MYKYQYQYSVPVFMAYLAKNMKFMIKVHEIEEK